MQYGPYCMDKILQNRASNGTNIYEKSVKIGTRIDIDKNGVPETTKIEPWPPKPATKDLPGPIHQSGF